MRKMLIVGAGGYGRELLQWVKDINRVKPTWDIAGFLDDNLDALHNTQCDYPVVGRVCEWQPRMDEEFALAIASPAVKEQVAKMLKARGATFPSVLHPTATITEFSHFGEGLVMFPHAKLSVNATVGDFVTILSSGVGHDVVVGDYTTICGFSSILRDVKIGNRVFVGSNVAIAQGINIGDDAYLGIGSVIIKDVKPGQRVFGNPAKLVPT